MKILVADTSKDSGLELLTILQEKEYECVLVEKSGEIIDKVYTESPDIILFDINLSDPGSFEVLEKLNSAPSTRDIPAILMASTKSRHKLARGYELGAYDYISKPYFREEIYARIKNIADIREKMREFEKLLVRDYLTGLYNRKFFMERLMEELSWAVMYSEPFSLMMLDIDHFKRVNDTYGHGCGDEILKQVADTLLSVLRAQDLVARYGGEEFIILMPNSDTESAANVAERMRAAVHEKEFLCNKYGNRIPVTISIGLTQFQGDVDLSSDNIISRADNALYAAKAGGRNRVVVYKDMDK